MNYDIILAIGFYLVLYLIFIIYRKRFDVQNKVFILYRTKLGLKLMDNIAVKFPRFLDMLGFLGVVSGFVGMAFIFWILIKGTYALFFVENAIPVLSPVLPGVKIAGLPVLSFWHWIIAILVIATIHEFFHGIYARRKDIKIKSSGFAFLGPLLAAFVEPDEKQMEKKSNYSQLQILSAGPFANILLAGVLFLIIGLILNPIGSAIIEERGVVINSIDKTMPIYATKIKEGMTIEEIDGKIVNNRIEFVEAINNYEPGKSVFVKANGNYYEILFGKNPKNESKAMMGVVVAPISIGLKDSIKEQYFNFYPAYNWIYELVFWLFVISLGVGLFNLLPLGPVDGGRMFYVAMLGIFKNENAAKKIYLFATWACLLLIFINLMPFIIDFFVWIWGLMI